jgi:hypothetical protein
MALPRIGVAEPGTWLSKRFALFGIQNFIQIRVDLRLLLLDTFWHSGNDARSWINRPLPRPPGSGF